MPGGWRLLRTFGERDFGSAARIALPTVLLTGGAAALLLAHDFATTGDVLTDPYSFNRQTQAPALLIGKSLQPDHPAPEQMDNCFRQEPLDFERGVRFRA